VPDSGERASGNARPQSGVLFMGRFDFQGERGNGSVAIFVFRVSRASSNAKAKNAPFDRLGANRAQPRYSITISAANATVEAGSEIRVQIVQKNTTDRDQPFWIVSVETTWRIRVLD
jgi:hypothetical protein